MYEFSWAFPGVVCKVSPEPPTPVPVDDQTRAGGGVSNRDPSDTRPTVGGAATDSGTFLLPVHSPGLLRDNMGASVPDGGARAVEPVRRVPYGSTVVTNDTMFVVITSDPSVALTGDEPAIVA